MGVDRVDYGRQAIEHASDGGEGGIRTPDTVPRIPVFKTGAINHSATSPELLQFYYSLRFSAVDGPAKLLKMDATRSRSCFEARPMSLARKSGISSQLLVLH